LSRLPDIKPVQSGDCRQTTLTAPATESPQGTPASLRVSSMAQSFYLREQAERCRRLASDAADPMLRHGLFKLADEFAARADAAENDDMAVWPTRPQRQGPD
jgi:hypothetical protein